MAKQILDLYQLYRLVVQHGGLVQVRYLAPLLFRVGSRHYSSLITTALDK